MAFAISMTVGAFAVAAISAYIFNVGRHKDSAAQLLAQAYSERRMLELRIPGGRPSPVQVERGGSSSSLDKPQSLLKAQAVIAAGLRANPDSPEWLDLKARADLIEGNYEPAIKDLQRAVEIRPGSAPLLTDLASGYFERAESTRSPIDYGNAVEALGKVLAATPDDPIALYNRGVASERLFLYSQAIDDYEHYLRVDSQGDWANDVRGRLAVLKQRLQQQQKSEIEPLLRPLQIAAGAGDASIQDQVDRRLEEYVQKALSDWLPAVSDARASNNGETAPIRRALIVLSQLSVSRHEDDWLAELLAGNDARPFSQAVNELAEAIESNDIGDDSAASSHALKAEKLFLLADNKAGAVRARVEYLFSFHEAQLGQPCLKAAGALQNEFQRKRYPWVLAQVQLEIGTCHWLTGNLDTARRFYERSEDLSRTTHYPVINLRAQDHLASLSAETGDQAASAALACRALGAYWSGAYPAMRGYNLYYGLYESSRLTNSPHLQMSVWRDGLRLSKSLSDRTLQAWAHSSMADAALAAGFPATAKGELETAGILFTAAPQTKATRIATGETETRLAAVELTMGLAGQAESRLRSHQAEISQLSDAFLGTYFDTVLGAAQEQTGDVVNAAHNLRAAIELSNIQLRSLHRDKPRIDWEKQSSEAYRYLVQLHMRRGEATEALAAWEAYLDSTNQDSTNQIVDRRDRGSSGSSGVPDSPERIESARIGLANETLIAFALLPQGLAVWVFDNRGVLGQFQNRRPSDVQAEVHRFRRLCSDPSSSLGDVRASGQALYGIFIKPIEAKLLPGRPLVVELDDKLAGVPMDALVDAQGRFLNEKLTISYSTGLYHDRHRSGPPTVSADSKVLAVGISTSQAIPGLRLDAILDVESESESVAHNFRSSTTLLGNEARVDAITARMATVAIFHFAGHAIASSAQSGLVLADGLLRTADIEGRSWPGLKLAVLSACDTQNDVAGGSRAYESLVRGFLRAGAANVVASDWDVDSAATRQFMQFFYASLLRGNPVPIAMHEAEIAMRSSPGKAHPYYWSAFASFA
jgi:CHAT domain-containing protein